VEITEVRIKLMEEPGERLKAFCSVTFDDCFVVRDLKIIEGTNGPFVAMPSRKLTSHCPKCGMKNHLRAAHCNQCGSRLEDGRAPKDAEGRAKLYADIAHPINCDCREMIQESVIREFYDEIERAKQPGYISRYDDFDVEYAEAPKARPNRIDSPHSAPAPMSRKSPSIVHSSTARSGSAPKAPVNPPAANRPAEPRPERRNDPPATLPRPAGAAEMPKGGNFGAGIFPER
jgi:stage V sporulation protein G